MEKPDAFQSRNIIGKNGKLLSRRTGVTEGKKMNTNGKLILHKFSKCTDPTCIGCHLCEGGLHYCTVCRATECELLSSCPGFVLNEETLEACYQGGVIDFLSFKYRN